MSSVSMGPVVIAAPPLSLAGVVPSMSREKTVLAIATLVIAAGIFVGIGGLHAYIYLPIVVVGSVMAAPALISTAVKCNQAFTRLKRCVEELQRKSALEQRCLTLEGQIGSLTLDKTNMQRAIDLQGIAQRDLELRCLELVNQMGMLNQEKSVLQVTISSHELEHTRLRREIDSLTQERSILQANAASQGSERNNFEQRSSVIQNEITRLSEYSNALQATIAAQTNRLTALEQSCKDLTLERREIQATLDTQTFQCRQVEQRCLGLQEEIERLAYAKRYLEAELSAQAVAHQSEMTQLRARILLPSDAAVNSPHGHSSFQEDVWKFMEMVVDPSVKTFWQRIINLFADSNHPTKLKKYQVTLDQYKMKYGGPLEDDFKKIEDLAGANKNNAAFQRLYSTLWVLRNPVRNNGHYDVVNFAMGLFVNVEKNYDNARGQYQEYVQVLRSVILSPEYQAIKNTPAAQLHPDALAVRTIVRKLCHIRWSGVDMYNYLQEVTDLNVAAYKEAAANYKMMQQVQAPNGMKIDLADLSFECNAKNFPAILGVANRQVNHTPSEEVGKSPAALAIQKASGASGAEDFTGSKNVPHRREIQVYRKEDNSTRFINYLRFGSPTAPFGLNGAAIDQKVVCDFEEFIATLDEMGKGLLFVIHQDRASASEGGRTSEIEKLQETHPNYHAFCQPFLDFDKKHKDLFFDGVNSFDLLQKKLKNAFLGGDKRFSLPLAVVRTEQDKEIYAAVMDKLMSDVREIFFAGQDPKPEQYLFFVDLFYIFQKIDLKFRLPNIEYYVTACKDFLDRGGCMALIEDYIHLCALGKQNEAEKLKEILNNIIGAAIQVKKIGVIEHRLMQGLELIHFINQLNLNKLQHHTYGNGWKIADVLVPKE